jgi:hypothetical protein
MGKLGGWQGSAYKDIPDNTNMLRVIRAQWDSGAKEMILTVDPGKNTRWSARALSNAQLGRFPWWSIYITCDQVVKVAIDDVYVLSETLPYSVDPKRKLTTRWGEIRDN